MSKTNQTKQQRVAPAIAHLLLIDDDPMFRRTMQQLGTRRNVHITVASSLHEVGAFAVPRYFDVAIVDYFLDDLKENLRGTSIAALMGETPVILVSRSNHCIEEHSPWPDSVRRFIPKEEGSDAILAVALQVMQPFSHGRETRETR